MAMDIVSGGDTIALKHWIWILFTTALSLFLTDSTQSAPKKRYTIMCYMNGDNDLTQEVLHAVDMMETVGSSENINIFALVDGGPEATPLYGDDWKGTKLLHISRDDTIGKIGSKVVADLGEQDLADPRTLQNFVGDCLRYPADKYLFFLFSHGRGIIDTRNLKTPIQPKALCISPDDTNRSIMTQQQFHDALKSAMGEIRFDLMVFFSCLTNMVEVGYSLRNTTRYLVASEDEIRIVDNPPGTFQIRGIKFETLLERLRDEPNLSSKELGKTVVDTFIEQYTQDISLPGNDKGFVLKRFAAGLSLIDCNYYDAVADRLDALACHLQLKMTDPTEAEPMLRSFRRALTVSQRYGSFLNLEYYDLKDFLENLQKEVQDLTTKKYCKEAIDDIYQRLIVYERHTGNDRSNGISVYLSHFLVPENVYQSHQKMYKASLFSQKTAWDEMIDLYRKKMRDKPSL